MAVMIVIEQPLQTNEPGMKHIGQSSVSWPGIVVWRERWRRN